MSRVNYVRRGQLPAVVTLIEGGMSLEQALATFELRTCDNCTWELQGADDWPCVTCMRLPRERPRDHWLPKEV